MSKPVSYKRHRFPPEIIAHAVWLYFRFPLSLRLVEEMLLERGIVVSYETVRRWALKFGPAYARRLRRKSQAVAISGTSTRSWSRSLARNTGCGGRLIRTAMCSMRSSRRRRDTKAAKRLLKRLLQKQGCPPRRMITDKLGSYAAAQRQIMPDVEHRSHKGLNNRAENSHLPFRRRERVRQGFRSPR